MKRLTFLANCFRCGHDTCWGVLDGAGNHLFYECKRCSYQWGHVGGVTGLTDAGALPVDSLKAAWDTADRELAAMPRSQQMMLYWLCNRKHGIALAGMPDDIDREWRREHAPKKEQS